MPNNPTVYKNGKYPATEGMITRWKLKRNQIPGKVMVNIEYNNKHIKLLLLITKRTDITPLLGENWLNQLPITINRISLDKETSQSKTTIHPKFKKLFETNHSIENTQVKLQKNRDVTQYNKEHDQYHISYKTT